MLKHLLYIIFLFITAFGQVVHGSELKTDEGTIRIAISENPGGDASSVYLLNSFVTESTKKLTFLTNPKNLRNGDRISIQYREVDDSNIVYHFERHQSPQRVMARNASFVEKVLVIPVVFSKASKSYNACTVGELQNVFFPQYENQSLNVFFKR